MKAKNNNLKMFLKVVLLGACACVGATTCAATYTWKADENGNWDGNITDPAHWECDTANRPASPETTSDKLSIKIPAGVQARITIDKDLSVGSFFSESGSHVTLVSIDKADTGEMTHLQLSSGLYIREGATLVLDHAKITNLGDSVSVQKGSVAIVKNCSLFWCKNLYFNNSSATSYWEISGKSTVDLGVLYIGGGNKFVIDDATMRCRSRVGIGTDSSTVTSDSTSLLFRGAEPKLVLYNDGWPDGRDLQVCGVNQKVDGDILNFDFLIPENGFNSTPIVMDDGDSSQYLFGAPYQNNPAAKGKLCFNLLEESPAVIARKRINQKLVEWTLVKGEHEEGFCKELMEEGIPPKKASEQTFSFEEPTENHFIYSVLLDCRPTGFKVIVR